MATLEFVPTTVSCSTRPELCFPRHTSLTIDSTVWSSHSYIRQAATLIGSQTRTAGHTLVVDVQRRELICASPCRDYVYLDAFDRAIQFHMPKNDPDVQLVHAANENVQRGVALEEPTFGPAYQ
eukprot:scaffold46184_cov16-Tisochrysis_lutea.AAC.3